MNSLRQVFALAALLAIVFVASSEAKLLRRSRFYDDQFDGPYPVPSGERAIVTVRGARHPFDGSAPAKIAIEDNPYRGPYPRGVYDRLDAGYGRGGARPYPYQHDMGGYGQNYGG